MGPLEDPSHPPSVAPPFSVTIAASDSQEFKPSEFGANQLKIAQLLTVKREQQIAQGIDNRSFRKMEKAKMLAMSPNALLRKHEAARTKN